MIAGAVIVAALLAGVIGFILGTIMLAAVSGGSHDDDLRAAYLAGRDSLELRDGDRVILETEHVLTPEMVERIGEAWESAGRAIVLEGGIKIAAIMRAPELAAERAFRGGYACGFRNAGGDEETLAEDLEYYGGTE